jgi:hypothetical protein
MPFFKQDNPFVLPTTDGKLIEEHIGASTGETGISIAHMLAPAGGVSLFKTQTLMNIPW